MHNGVEHHNDLAIDFHGMGDGHGIVVEAYQPLGDAGFSGTGRAMQEDGPLSGKGGTDPVHQLITHHQIGEGAAHITGIEMRLGP